MASLITDARQAANLILQGQLVAFPTETVYGLGCDATNQVACAKVYEIKGRPSLNPLIVHVASLEQAQQFGEFSDDALKLAAHFWPGPLTIVVPLKCTSLIAANARANLNTIAIRVPNNPIALELLRITQKPLAAPSANISNYISATNYHHVLDDFANTDLHILYSQASCSLKSVNYIGIESTILDTSTGKILMLRAGAIDEQEIMARANISISSAMEGSIKAPGMLQKHYSPTAKLRLNAKDLQPHEVGIDFANQLDSSSVQFTLSSTGNLAEAAMNLYTVLRWADKYATLRGMHLAIANIPHQGIGIAINDKLNRAAK